MSSASSPHTSSVSRKPVNSRPENSRPDNGRPKPVKKKSSSMMGAIGRGEKMDNRTRKQIKDQLLSGQHPREVTDAPPNSDAKDESMRIFEKQKADNPKEEYVSKQPQIGKRHSKKGRPETSRPRRHTSENGLKLHEPTSKDNSLFKERASANNSNVNSPDSSLRSKAKDKKEDATQIIVESTKVDLEPEQNVDQTRRKNEAVFMKKFITALQYSRPKPTKQPKSEDSDSSKRAAPRK